MTTPLHMPYIGDTGAFIRGNRRKIAAIKERLWIAKNVGSDGNEVKNAAFDVLLL